MKNSAGKPAGWVIHFSADDYWHSNPHSRHHITEQPGKHYNILWVNPIGSRMPSFKKKGFTARIIRKLVSLTKFLKKVRNGYYVITFISVPYFKEGGIQHINRLFTKAQIRMSTGLLEIRKPLLFFTTPVYACALDMISHPFSVYYHSDQLSAYREFSRETRRFTENPDKKHYKKADLILCASQKIYDTVSEKTAEKVRYFSHQVNYSCFSEKEGTELPEDMKSIRKPVIGYYGTLTDSNDWNTIRYCAEKRSNYSFVPIGRKDIKNTGPEDLPNVCFPGKKPFSEIPLYGKSFDVGIMFWIRREWITNCSPLKLKEYLSLGIPVVNSRIEEVEKLYSDMVLIADDKDEFLERLDISVTCDSSNRINRGIEKVKNDSWYNAIKIIEHEMAEDYKIQIS